MPFDRRRLAWILLPLSPVLFSVNMLACTAYSFCVHELGPSRTSISLYLGPSQVGLMAWAVLGERPQWHHLVGIALVLPGLFLATRPIAKGA